MKTTRYELQTIFHPKIVGDRWTKSGLDYMYGSKEEKIKYAESANRSKVFLGTQDIRNRVVKIQDGKIDEVVYPKPKKKAKRGK